MEDSRAIEDMRTLHSVDEAADILGRSHWTVRWRIRHGLMQPVHIGKRLFLSSTELLRVLGKERAKKVHR